jgi:DNA replication protein DnaC
MESLNDILKRIAATSSSSNTSNETERAETSEEQAYCEICDDARWLNVDAPIGSPEFGTVVPCKCQEQVWGAHSRNRLRDYSDLGPLERMTFESMEPTGRDGFVDAPSFRRAKDVAQTYSHDPMGWLIISGPSGTGKTHLAAAIANRLIADNRPAKFVSVPDLLDHMRATLDRDDNDTDAEDFESLFVHIIEAPMLILDDLGVQSPTRWAEEKIDQVLSHRYARRLPTVLTTSTPVEQMPDRLRTRVLDPFMSHRIELLAGVGNADRSAIGLDTSQLKAMTFESFDPRGRKDSSQRQRHTLESAFGAARSFAEIPQGWIYLAGPTGVGKTHLAVAITNVQVKQGRTVLFRFVPDLLDQLRRAYQPSSGTGFDREFQVIRNCEVLILDDLGTQASTPWAEEKLYQLIVHRHSAGLPTVITSRILLDEAAANSFTSRYADAIASRMRDTHVVWEYPMFAPDYRQRGTSAQADAEPEPTSKQDAPQRRRTTRAK